MRETYYLNHFLKGCLIPLVAFWLFFVSTLPTQAQQPPYQQLIDIPFEVNGSLLPNPLAGGLAMPQFNNLDLNQDGTNDLLIFDRVGRKMIPFVQLADGTYAYRPEYEAIFPALQNFVLLYDFDQDGVKDIISSTSESVLAELVIYKGYQDANQQWFEPFSFQVMDSLASSIEIHAFDIPAVKDVDQDGDMDVLLFPASGIHIAYYENQSVEEGFGSDSLHFRLVHECWGLVAYEDEGIDLNACTDSLIAGGGTASSRCADCLGSMLYAFDYDADQQMDLLFSGLTDTYLYLLSNNGSSIINKDTSFLLGDITEMPSFPAIFEVGINQDSFPDFCVASNRLGDALTGKTGDRFLYYENSGTSEPTPSYQLKSESFMVDQMVDEGFGSSVATLDYNWDGLIDIVVSGNVEDPFFSYKSSLSLYENTGTPEAPAFRLVDTDFGDILRYTLKEAHPTFGDVDNDGDPDMVVGNFLGDLKYFENTAGQNKVPVFELRPMAFPNFDLGFSSKPQLVDIDRDGQLDLLIGSSKGALYYLKNQTAPNSNTAVFEVVNENLGELSQNRFNVDGAPLLFTPAPGQPYQLLHATSDGQINFYEDIESQLEMAWTSKNSFFGQIHVGENPTMTAADLDNDGRPELLFGNSRGGLSIYSPPLKVAVNEYEKEVNYRPEVLISPNPAKNFIKINIKSTRNQEIRLSLVNSYSKSFLSQSLYTNNFPIKLETKDLASGIYFCQLSTDTWSDTQMIIILK